MDTLVASKITHGMYVLTTIGGGCIVDAVAQVSGGDNPLIAVSVMKKNYTNELMHKENKFALSVLGKDVKADIIKTFGFNSGRDINKFKDIAVTDVGGVKVIDNALAHIVCEKVDAIENATHTLFLGKIIDGEINSDDEPMSYGYYQKHKDEVLKVTTSNGKTAWICKVCGYIYYGDELPKDYICPVCGVGADKFEKRS